MSTSDPREQMSDEELRAAYEAQLKQLRVEHILLDNVVALINLAMRRTGLAPGTEAERDPGQVRLAIEAVRALMPQVEQIAPGEAGQIRGALSQLQLAYVKIGGQAPAAAGDAAEPASNEPASQETAPPANPGEPGPAQRSGRLWVPGQ